VVLELNEIIGDKNIVQISVDERIPNFYRGSSASIIQPIKLISAFMASNLANGIIFFELMEWSESLNKVTLQVRITGRGTTELKISPHYKSEAELIDQFESTAAAQPGISFSVTKGVMVATVKVIIDVKDKSDLPISSQFKNKKVLIIEDNEVNVLVFTSFMEGWGASVECAYNGEDGVEMAWTNEYDAIIMDIYMPKMCGIEATRKIREFNDTIPIIALSASALDEDKRNASNAGVNEYLSKPVSSDVLHNVLLKFLSCTHS